MGLFSHFLNRAPASLAQPAITGPLIGRPPTAGVHVALQHRQKYQADDQHDEASRRRGGE